MVLLDRTIQRPRVGAANESDYRLDARSPPSRGQASQAMTRILDVPHELARVA